MKKLMALVFALVCVLALVGCSTESDKETQLGNDVIETPEKEGQTDETLIDDDAVDYPTEDIATDLATTNLTIRTLKALVDRYGEDLSWSNFNTYYSEDVGSGLYILRYPIDTDYCLLIGGASMDEEPMYIRLVSEHNTDIYIDVRTDSIDDFLNNDK